jgi:hypothetical protein
MKNRFFILIIILTGIVSACGKDWLDERPKGGLNEYTIATKEGIDALLVGAYSMLDGVSSQFGWEAASSNWLYGSIRGLEANKGTDAGDSGGENPIVSYGELPSHPSLNIKWCEVYAAVARCNSAILVTGRALNEGTITKEQADLFLKQARALRGWYHFEAWRMWAMIPFVDENTDACEITNTTDIRDKIITDLQEGTMLPGDMGQVGRFNSTVCKVLLAKALMQMYHNYSAALPLLEDVKNNGIKPNGEPIGLAPTYGEVFDIENRNGIESVYTVQYSVNDGSGGYNGGWGEVLNFPYKIGGSPAGCCGFYQPTQEFVNSFRTSGGLPLLDYSYNLPENSDFRDQGVKGGDIWDSTKTYGTDPYYPYGRDACTAYDPAHPFTDLGYQSLIDDNKGNNPITSPDAWELKWTEDNSKPTDPRLDWTVGRRGIPYWDWGVHTGSDWIRDQSYAGPYSPKKQVYKKSQEGKYTEVGNWTSGWTANGYRMIRYADVLLLLSECQIETGDLSGALANINAVRARAANPDGFVKEADGVTPAANYQISVYPSFPDQEYARKALRMERKLELGMEGHRWFDLNRWGITVTELNRALEYEKTTPWGPLMYWWSAAVGPEDATYPIPQRQIDLSHGRLVQNR